MTKERNIHICVIRVEQHPAFGIRRLSAEEVCKRFDKEAPASCHDRCHRRMQGLAASQKT